MGPTKRGKPVKRQDAPGIKRESSTLFVYGSYAVGVAVSCVAVMLGLLLNKNSGLEFDGGVKKGLSEKNLSSDIASSFTQLTSKTDENAKEISLQKNFTWLSEIHYSQYDRTIASEIRAGAKYLESPDTLQQAVNFYNTLVKSNAKSAQAHYMLALATHGLAEKQRSNEYLQEAINILNLALQCPDIPATAEIIISTLRAEYLRFFGKMGQVVRQWEVLLNKYPDHIEIMNQLGTAYCYNERKQSSKEKARQTFEEVLKLDADNSYAAAHLGFVRFVYDRDASAAAPLLIKALSGQDERVTKNSKFYSKAGDVLYRLGQKEKADYLFRQGAEMGVFLSAMQRSPFNVEHLTGRGWWKLSQLPQDYQHHLKKLKKHWRTIRDEGLSLIDSKTGLFKSEDENLREYGSWKQFTLFSRGKEHKMECQRAPQTCELLRSFKAATTNKRGQIKFSLLLPETRVWPHTGPTNCRLRPHMGLKIPPGVGIEVAGTNGTWKEGDFIVIDDSFQHHVWHEGTEPRLILIVDVWHPELTESERKTLSAI